MLIHQGRIVQHGRGLGGMIASLTRSLIPVLKVGAKVGAKVGKKMLTSKTAKRMIKNVKNHAKDALIDLGSDVLSGENVEEAAQQRLKQTKRRIGEDLSQNLRAYKRSRRDFGSNPRIANNEIPPKKKRRSANSSRKRVIKRQLI